MVFGERELMRGVGGGPQFAVDFAGVGVPKALSLSNGARRASSNVLAGSMARMESAASSGGRRFCQ